MFAAPGAATLCGDALQPRMLTTPAPLTHPNQVIPSSDPRALGIPSATESPSVVPSTGTVTVLHENPSTPPNARIAINDRCCLIGVPPPIVTAPAADTWNCAVVPTASAAVSELFPMEKFPLGKSVTWATPLFVNKPTESFDVDPSCTPLAPALP